MMILMESTINLMGSINPQYTEEMVKRLEMGGKVRAVLKDGKPLFPYVIFEEGDINFNKFEK